MLTLKLLNLRGGRTTIVETVRVEAVPREGGGSILRCFPPEGVAEEHEVFPGGDYDRAYVENAQGATVQIIKHDR